MHHDPLFVFTLLREPTSHAISYFNFFHQTLESKPEEVRLRSLVFNRQCHTLASTVGKGRRRPHICATLYDKFLELFDWVGTTEHLTEETMPLLQHLLRFKTTEEEKGNETSKNNSEKQWPPPPPPVSQFHSTVTNNESHYNVAVSSHVSLHRDTLSSYTLEYIQNKTCLDRGLWERVQQDYTLDLFSDYIV